MLGLDVLQGRHETADVDQRVILHDVGWQEFELLLAIRGDQAGVRMTYREGELELMTPSRSHEGVRVTISRILEAYAMARGLTLEGFGSWTLTSAPRKRALEPDACYILGDLTRDRPDLALEVVWTSGGIDKLDVYRGLGVPEVWVWRQGEIAVHVLGDGSYSRSDRSRLLPDFDLRLVERCLLEARSQTEAVKTFLASLNPQS